MGLARLTSCAPVRSGTLPISFRYIRTGSETPPSPARSGLTFSPWADSAVGARRALAIG